MACFRVVVLSDIHFPAHHRGAWAAVKEWIEDKEGGDLLVIDGDLVDLSILSRYEPGAGDPLVVVHELKQAVEEVNEVASHFDRTVIILGNHEDRWSKALLGNRAPHFRGCKGLSLEEQLRAQGLKSDIQIFKETAKVPSFKIGKNIHIMHGHNQAGGYGIKNIASTNASRFAGVHSLVGHHHRAQIYWRSIMNKPFVSIANPHLSDTHEYSKTPDWQRGFTILDVWGAWRLRDCEKVTAYQVVMDRNGQFVWDGVKYGGSR